MALITINDEKEHIGYNIDVLQISKTPKATFSQINFENEADQLYCFLKAVCSDELFKAIVKRFGNETT